MDELSFLIIDKTYPQQYYSTASLLNLFPRDPDLIGFRDTRLLQGFEFLIAQGLLVPHPISGGTGHDYMLSEKGEGAYLQEKKRRAELARREELQVKQSKSAIQTNESVMATNKSVADTNESVQSLNKLYADNIPRQNRYVKINIAAVIGSVLIAGILLVNVFVAKPDSDIVKQLQQNNALLQTQIRKLDTILSRQIALDSLLSTKMPPAKSK